LGDRVSPLKTGLPTVFESTSKIGLLTSFDLRLLPPASSRAFMGPPTRLELPYGFRSTTALKGQLQCSLERFGIRALLLPADPKSTRACTLKAEIAA
jgi:hypothetical protein